MDQILNLIEQADPQELEIILDEVLDRYEILFPQWSVSLVSVQHTADRNEQIDRMICMLQKLKE